MEEKEFKFKVATCFVTGFFTKKLAIIGVVEAGEVAVGDTINLPAGPFTVDSIEASRKKVASAGVGQQVSILIKGANIPIPPAGAIITK